MHPERNREEARRKGEEEPQDLRSEAESNGEPAPMSRPLRAAVRVISAALFLLLIWLVVLGSDSVIAWIKSLF